MCSFPAADCTPAHATCLAQSPPFSLVPACLPIRDHARHSLPACNCRHAPQLKGADGVRSVYEMFRRVPGIDADKAPALFEYLGGEQKGA